MILYCVYMMMGHFINLSRAVASYMRRTEALALVKFYQILSIFIFFIRLIILEDFIRLISYNGPCVRLGCSFFLATALLSYLKMHFMLIKYMCDAKLQSFRMHYPFQSTCRLISHQNGWLFCMYIHSSSLNEILAPVQHNWVECRLG